MTWFWKELWLSIKDMWAFIVLITFSALFLIAFLLTNHTAGAFAQTSLLVLSSICSLGVLPLSMYHVPKHQVRPPDLSVVIAVVGSALGGFIAIYGIVRSNLGDLLVGILTVALAFAARNAIRRKDEKLKPAE